MNFEEFKNKVSFVLRKKDDNSLSFKENVERLFLRNHYTIDELNIVDDSCFKAKVNKIAWLADSTESLPLVHREIVGRKIGKEFVLLVDEKLKDNKYTYFEIYDESYNVIKRLWLGDFLVNKRNYYNENILRNFKDDLPYSFLWRVSEDGKVLKKINIR